MKNRSIPNKETHPHAYQMFISTVGKSKGSIHLMEEIIREYNKGNDYFQVLKYIGNFSTELKQIELMTNKQIQRYFSLICLNEKTNFINALNLPDRIKSFSRNVLLTFFRKFNDIRKNK